MLLIIDNNCVAGQKYYRAAPSLWLVRLNGIIAERFYRRVSVRGGALVWIVSGSTDMENGFLELTVSWK